MSDTKMRTCTICEIKKELNTDNFYKNGIDKKNEIKYKGKCKKCFISNSYTKASEKSDVERLAYNKRYLTLYHKDVVKSRKWQREYQTKRRKEKKERKESQE